MHSAGNEEGGETVTGGNALSTRGSPPLNSPPPPHAHLIIAPACHRRLLGEKTKRRQRCCFEEREEVRSDRALTQPDPLTRPSVFTGAIKLPFATGLTGHESLPPAGGRRSQPHLSATLYFPRALVRAVLRNTGAGADRSLNRRLTGVRRLPCPLMARFPVGRHGPDFSPCMPCFSAFAVLLASPLWCAATYSLRQQSER